MFNLVKKIIIVCLTLFFLLFVWLLLTLFLPVGVKKEYVVNVENGDNSQFFAEKLNASGLDFNKTLFSLLVKSKDVDRKIKVGQYSFIGPISMWQVVNQIANTTSTEIKITLIEGWSAKQVATYLEKQGLVKADEFIKYINQPPKSLYSEFSFLKTGKSLEGYLFPDTYFVYKNVTTEELVALFLKTFEKKVGSQLSNNWSTNFYNTLVLASIVQDEVSNNADMTKVADIFIKRLKDNMPLQSDATVNYITGKGMASPLISDTEIDNPYNTYRNKGLPPTPISNPGVQAIKAVINPLANPYYYFLTTKDGQTIYSKTFAEHVANKNKYLK